MTHALASLKHQRPMPAGSPSPWLLAAVCFFGYPVVAVEYVVFVGAGLLSVSDDLPVSWLDPIGAGVLLAFPLLIGAAFLTLLCSHEQRGALGLALGWLANLIASALAAWWYAATVTGEAATFFLVGGVAGYPMWLLAWPMYLISQALQI